MLSFEIAHLIKIREEWAKHNKDKSYPKYIQYLLNDKTIQQHSLTDYTDSETKLGTTAGIANLQLVSTCVSSVAVCKSIHSQSTNDKKDLMMTGASLISMYL